MLQGLAKIFSKKTDVDIMEEELDERSEASSPLETVVWYFSKACFLFGVGRGGIFGGVMQSIKYKFEK